MAEPVAPPRPRRPRRAFVHLIDTPLRRGACTVCHQTTMIAHTCGVRFALDPHALDARAETMSVLKGLPTFELIRIASQFEIRYRDAFHIRLDATKGRPVVFGGHDCPVGEM